LEKDTSGFSLVSRYGICRNFHCRKEDDMLGDANASPMLPVKDLEKAEKFYEDILGLHRVHEEPGVVATYRSGGTTLNVYRSEFAGTNKGTAALWEVEDVERAVKDLKKKGVKFEHYDKCRA
jgi:catechol 2,3-dioxygenase-like lactoylglutathione lyase family enzyme